MSHGARGATTARAAALALVIVVALLATLAWTLWSALRALDPGPAAAVITASATALISVLSLIISRRAEQRRAIEQTHRDRKLPIYDDFIHFWFTQIQADKLGVPPKTEEEIVRFTVEFSQKITLWGPDAFIRAYNDFRSALLTADLEKDEISPTFALEDLLHAMRKDMGHANKALIRGDLLRLYINDVDDYLSSREAS